MTISPQLQAVVYLLLMH